MVADVGVRKAHPNLRRTYMLLRILLTAALIYVLIVVLAWAFQRHLLYLPNVTGDLVTATPADRGWRYEPVTLSATTA